MQKTSSDSNEISERQALLAILARAEGIEIDAALAALAPLPEAQDLRRPETGLVMMRGRTGGDGAPFNLGEATVSRAAVRLPGGEVGFGYRLGRDVRAARAAAVLDALWQEPARRAAVEGALEPVRRRLIQEDATVRTETAATKVDFFTLVRGED